MLKLGVPVLGICYGMQWLAHSLGGKVERAERREYGRAQLDIERDSKLFAGVPAQLKVWNSHGDHVVGLPAGFHVTARTDNAVAAVENPDIAVLRRRISSRSESHRSRNRHPAQFRLRHLRREAELESRGIYRRDG